MKPGNPIIYIGTTGGRIAVLCDEEDAYELAALYGPSDSFYEEIVGAIGRAYPEREDTDD